MIFGKRYDQYATLSYCWFAWRPVHLENGCWAWLQYVAVEEFLKHRRSAFSSDFSIRRIINHKLYYEDFDEDEYYGS
jgi:hypothetical protein